MKNALTCLTNEEKQAIEKSIHEAESRTRAEIVCAIATESGRYDRAESVGALIISFLALAGVYALWGAWTPPGTWQGTAEPGLFLVLFVMTVGFIVGSLWLSRAYSVRRWLTGANEMERETQKAAGFVFCTHGLRRTRGQTGLLIYVSLYERRVVVLSDDGIASALGTDFLNDLRNVTVAALKQGRPADAFQRSIELAVNRLAQPFPPASRDTDEIPNQLIVIHPRP